MTQTKKSKKTTEEKTKNTSEEQQPAIALIETEEPKLEVEKDVITGVLPEKEEEFQTAILPENLENWKPKTTIGMKVKTGEIKKIDEILQNGIQIVEPQITDILLPELKHELLLIGQSKGKFGGGQKRAFRQTQKKTPEGNKPSFGAMVVIGDEKGHIGLGYGKSKDTVPAREEAIRNAKLEVFAIKRGCGSWQCNCKTPHSIPFTVEGKCGSVIVRFMPAPKGKGLCVEKECAKIFRLAGVKDVWGQTFGQTRVKINVLKAAIIAFHKLTSTKTLLQHREALGMTE